MALNLADALDQLQAHLPMNRSVSITSYQHGYLKGRLSVTVMSGEGYTDADEIRGNSGGEGVKLSDALFEAERKHADAWRAKHYAEGEFGPIMPALRLAA